MKDNDHDTVDELNDVAQSNNDQHTPLEKVPDPFNGVDIAAHPHDHFFHYAMQKRETYLAFFKEYLPPDIYNRINLDDLSFVSEKFIDPNLKRNEADCIFKTQMDNQTAYLYVSIEHQSTVDKLIAFRLWQYMLAIMKKHITFYDTETLPIVYPLLVYNGEASHPKDILDFSQLFQVDPALIRSILYAPFHMIDTHDLSLKNKKNYQMLNSMLFSMKHARQIEAGLPELKKLIIGFSQAGQSEYIYAMLLYIMSVDKRPQSEVRSIFLDMLRETNIDPPSVLRQLQKEGEEIGLLKGEEIGLLKGKEETAVNMMKAGFEVTVVAQITELSVSHIQALFKKHQD